MMTSHFDVVDALVQEFHFPQVVRVVFHRISVDWTLLLHEYVDSCDIQPIPWIFPHIHAGDFLKIYLTMSVMY